MASIQINQKNMRLLLASILFISVLGCSKSTGSITPVPPVPPVPPVVVAPLIKLPPGWKHDKSSTVNFPGNVQLYTFDSTWGGKQTRAYCFAYESSNTSLEFKPVMAAAAQTPAAFVQQEPGTVYACINGGYFGSNQSYSLVKHNNVTGSPNIKLLSRPLGHYYPTRAAFGMLATGAPSAAWIYHIGSGNENIQSYPVPSPNDVNLPPLAVPDAAFPAGGTTWNILSGIGGSPMLVYNNEIRISDKEELIDINNTSSRSRSAIGYNTAGIVLMVAIQGDNQVPGYAGLNLQELAAMMKDLGCSHAMNLDGGGSTSMIVGGRQTVKPSTSGVERPVVSVLMIKRK
jgi:hypothetical protein